VGVPVGAELALSARSRAQMALRTIPGAQPVPGRTAAHPAEASLLDGPGHPRLRLPPRLGVSGRSSVACGGVLRAGPASRWLRRSGIPGRRRPSARRPASPLRALRMRQSPATDDGLASPQRVRLDSGQRQTASANACPSPRTASASPGPGALWHIMPGRTCVNPMACDRRSRLSSAFPPPPCVPNAT